MTALALIGVALGASLLSALVMPLSRLAGFVFPDEVLGAIAGVVLIAALMGGTALVVG